MANIKLVDNYWETSGIYDKAEGKTQREVNSDLKNTLSTLVEIKSVTAIGSDDYFIELPIAAGDKIKVSTTVGVNIHTRATKTGANIEELGYVSPGQSPKVFTATQNASWLKLYYTGAGSSTFENINRRLPIVEGKVAELEAEKAESSDLAETDLKVDNLNSNFDEAITSYVNLLDRTTLNNNKVWSRTTGAMTDNVNARAYNKIPIKSGVTYYYKDIYAYFSLVEKSDGTFSAISDDTTSKLSGSFIAPDDGFICITLDNTAINMMLTVSQEMYNSGISTTRYYPNKLDVGNKVFYCGVGREYTTLRSAIAEAVKWKNAKVYVDPGTYDLCTEFASEISANQSGVKFGIGLSNGVHVIFAAGAKVLAKYTGSETNIVEYFNPFYAKDDGSFTLENLDIDASNTRYCVHDEMGNTASPSRIVKYINCKMVFDNTSGPLNWFPQCIGGGNGKHDYITIENCYFKSKAAETNIKGLVSYHNNGSSTFVTSEANINISNCYFADKGTFRCSYYGVSEKVSSAYLNNNSFGANPIIGQETSGGSAPENYQIISWMNEIRS